MIRCCRAEKGQGEHSGARQARKGGEEDEATAMVNDWDRHRHSGISESD